MAKKTPETNPFIQSLEIKGLWKMKHDVLDPGNGESSGKVEVYECRVIDAEHRVNVFTEDLLDWFSNLSTSAKDMFMYIASKLPVNKDVVEMTEEAYMARMGISRSTYHSAKLALTNRLIIPRTSRKNTYWVNPAYLFRGDRVIAYRANVKVINDHPLKNRIAPATVISM